VSASATISPTAHYTGYVWARNGLSHPELETVEGRILFESLRPTLALTSALRDLSLEGYLLARHRAIDALLERAIEQDGIGQVIEVAAGLSPCGWRFTTRYPERLTYIETDLPGMARRKRDALERMGSLSNRHRVQELDALSGAGTHSLAALASALEPGVGLAIITEGLLGYLDRATVERLWRRFADTLGQFAIGRYISDIHLGEVERSPLVDGFRVLLSLFVRARAHLHFASAAEARGALEEAGFGAAEVRPAAKLADHRRPGSHLAHVLYACTR
jgi:O-methyltransferase involved in polyketide biosynthesis